MLYVRYSCLLLVLGAFLSGCQSTAVHTPDEDELMMEMPHWLALESDFHCYPVDEYAASEPSYNSYFPLAPDDDIWLRLRSGLILEYVDNPRVNAQLRWYVNNPQYLERVQQRSARYLYYILEQLHIHDVPYDMALLPIVESAYQPFAYSHGQAAGLWQFIPMTGRRFNLEQNWWIDERRDVVDSTYAAIRYLKYLNRFFDGDWELALAAYNAGEGTVRNAIRRNQRRGRPTDFWHLDLPAETQAYVPKMIALSEVFSNPERYEIPQVSIPNRPYFTSVTLNEQIDLLQAADLAGISIEELYHLNPALNRWATPPGGNYQLKLPLNAEMRFVSALSELPVEQRVTWQRHTIASGESLNSIAQKYRSNIDWIREANQLRSDIIVAGRTLMIPVASGDQRHYRYSQSERLSQRQNRAPGNNLQKIDYRVQAGDSFWKIARDHGVEIQALARWNNKAPRDVLHEGETLAIWLEPEQVSRFQAREERITRINYRVRRGDSLGRIANRFNVGVSDIVQWNNLDSSRYLQPGQALTLYVDVMNTSH